MLSTGKRRKQASTTSSSTAQKRMWPSTNSPSQCNLPKNPWAFLRWTWPKDCLTEATWHRPSTSTRRSRVHLIEPTETESKDTLDTFAEHFAQVLKTEPEALHEAPSPRPYVVSTRSMPHETCVCVIPTMMIEIRKVIPSCHDPTVWKAFPVVGQSAR